MIRSRVISLIISFAQFLFNVNIENGWCPIK